MLTINYNPHGDEGILLILDIVREIYPTWCLPCGRNLDFLTLLLAYIVLFNLLRCFYACVIFVCLLLAVQGVCQLRLHLFVNKLKLWAHGSLLLCHHTPSQSPELPSNG